MNAVVVALCALGAAPWLYVWFRCMTLDLEDRREAFPVRDPHEQILRELDAEFPAALALPASPCETDCICRD